MCYGHHARDSEDERKKEAEKRLKRMIQDQDPSSNDPEDDGTGLLVFNLEDKKDASRKEPELA